MPLAVSAAIILHNGLYLAARRAPGKSSEGLWEFPGGKIELGETAEAALVREIREELALDILLGDAVGVFTTEVSGTLIQLHCFYAFPIPTKQNPSVTTMAFEADHDAETAALQESPLPNLTLNDHSEIKWCELSELKDLNWAPADTPVIEWLMQLS